MWHRKGEYCPEGTVPILRSSIENLPPKKPSTRRTSNYTNLIASKVANNEAHILKLVWLQVAVAALPGQDYHGANAVINVWNPQVEPNEFSAAQIWVTDGGGTKIESIEAGWIVSIVTDFNPHPSFFTYWTSDGYQTTGCFNLLCPGFVLLTTRVIVGARLEPVSTYGGIQKIVRIRITQDLKSGNWFLYFQGELVGYWPAELFKNLNTSATLMEWGGEIINNKANGTHTGTQMGSGHFPTEGDGKAAYFTNLEYVDGGGLVNSATGVMSETSRSECYDIAVKDPDEKFGVYFLFGGPGLSIECYS
ncbi:hypothetical protein LINPERPRIM_LOCUS19262 [Linum perenne]